MVFSSASSPAPRWLWIINLSSGMWSRTFHGLFSGASAADEGGTHARRSRQGREARSRFMMDGFTVLEARVAEFTCEGCEIVKHQVRRRIALLCLCGGGLSSEDQHPERTRAARHFDVSVEA